MKPRENAGSTVAPDYSTPLSSLISPLLSGEVLLCFVFACASDYIIHQSHPTQSHTLSQFAYDGAAHIIKHCFI